MMHKGFLLSETTFCVEFIKQKQLQLVVAFHMITLDPSLTPKDIEIFRFQERLFSWETTQTFDKFLFYEIFCPNVRREKRKASINVIG